MSEFYGPAAVDGLGDPGADPVLTVRMQPPNTQARCLDLATPRAVKVGERVWAVAPGPGVPPYTVRCDAVATWPVVHPVTIGAAQRLAAGRATGSTGAAPELPADEDERPFR